MRILINASNLRIGGGIQVADSICREINRFKEHDFIIVLPREMNYLFPLLKTPNIILIKEYNIPNSIINIVFGRNKFLDSLVEVYNINAVITIFGPSKWKPKCFHLCGFAMPHIVLNKSPYWKTISKWKLLKTKLRNILMSRDFKRNSTQLWSESEYISQLLRKKYLSKTVYTISNNCNQVFNNPDEWVSNIKLPRFEGLTLLTITSSYPHKNLRISIDALRELAVLAPNLKIRFVFTVTKDEFGSIPNEYQDNFILLGKVNINQCPNLYRQTDIMFQPSLLECFTATYAEAMKMNVPIITTDLGFAHSLCGDAAYYYSPINPKDLALAICALNSECLRKELARKGNLQLKKFYSFSERADKLIDIVNQYVNS